MNAIASTTRSGSSYRIQRGDTLWAIASRLRAQGVPGSVPSLIKQIAAMNGIKNPNLIITGHTLRLPGKSGAPVSLGGSSFSPAQHAPVSFDVTSPASSSGADALRAKVAQWAIAQADDPRIGYSQTKGRFGNRTDANGLRYFDCSGLVYTAYKQMGVTLGGNWTGAMRSTWPQWADQVPKSLSAMKPGDLLLMNGHVVMYIGNGRCVGAQTSHTNLRDQVTTDISAARYLSRPDCIVLRPRVPAALA